MDSDVIVISIGIFSKLCRNTYLRDVYILYGSGKNLHRYSTKSMCESLGEDKSSALSLINTLSGCDDNSGPNGKAKKSFWKAWQAYPNITDRLKQILENPFLRIEILPSLPRLKDSL